MLRSMPRSVKVRSASQSWERRRRFRYAGISFCTYSGSRPSTSPEENFTASISLWENWWRSEAEVSRFLEGSSSMTMRG